MIVIALVSSTLVVVPTGLYAVGSRQANDAIAKARRQATGITIRSRDIASSSYLGTSDPIADAFHIDGLRTSLKQVREGWCVTITVRRLTKHCTGRSATPSEGPLSS